MPKLALTADINGEARYLGKIVGDTFYRNFNFAKATKWETKEYSFDARVLPILERKKVKWIVFMDTVKKKAKKIGIRKFKNNHREDDYGEGTQLYIHRDHCDRMDYPDVPYVGKEYDISLSEKVPVLNKETEIVEYYPEGEVPTLGEGFEVLK